MLQTFRSLSFKRVAAIGIYVIILLGSSVPGKQIPKFFQLTPDKLIHCLEYFVLGFMLARWANAEFETSGKRTIHAIILMIGATGGMIDELYQNLIPNRSPDFYDWCLDTIGVILSIPAYTFWRIKIFQE